MDNTWIPVVSGTIASTLFMSGSLPMLWKAKTTRNLSSYSLLQISLSNTGNLINWLYVISLPVGPIWLLHFFNTIVAGLMLVWYLRYERLPKQVLLHQQAGQGAPV